MPKLCQIVAITTGRKSSATREITELHHHSTKETLVKGLSRNYSPRDENGEKLAPEGNKVQASSEAAIVKAVDIWSSLIDVIATQDYANCVAKGDIIVDGEVVVSGVPVTHLMFLEKQMNDIHTFVEKLPVLDPSLDWTYDPTRSCYKSNQTEQFRTQKVQEPLVLAPATDKHPAQTSLITKDVVVGTWYTTHFSGALPADQKKGYLNKIEKIQDAIKFAREQANQIEAPEVKVSNALIGFLKKPSK